MTNELKPILDLIKRQCPSYSEEDIKKAIITCIESKSLEIIQELKLPPKKSSLSSVTEQFKQARSRARDFRLNEKNSKEELLYELEIVREKLLESGETHSANTIAEDIQQIGNSSTTLEGCSLITDAHIATLVEKQSISDAKTNENLKKLEQLLEND
jgi:hypothetical protein